MIVLDLQMWRAGHRGPWLRCAAEEAVRAAGESVAHGPADLEDHQVPVHRQAEQVGGRRANQGGIPGKMESKATMCTLCSYWRLFLKNTKEKENHPASIQFKYF